MTEYAPEPTDLQLDSLSSELNRRLRYSHRIVGGAGGTVDVIVGEDGERLILKRYWLPEPDETVDPARSEFRALQLAAAHGIPAPMPLWIDEDGIFPERAVTMSFIDAIPLIDPDDQLDWAAQLASILVSIHGISPSEGDEAVFSSVGPNDPHSTLAETGESPEGKTRHVEIWDALRSERNQFTPVDEVYVHSDFWPGNTLWSGQDLIAVIDWEGGCLADPALDVAWCEFDIRMLGFDAAADHFVESYQRLSGQPMPNLRFWKLLAIRRPFPDVAIWVPGWNALGLPITVDQARHRHSTLIDRLLESSN